MKYIFADSDCTTTLGSPGACVDVHLCRVALNQVWLEHLFPRVCPGGDPGSVRVCCQIAEGKGQCGAAHAQGEGIEG